MADPAPRPTAVRWRLVALLSAFSLTSYMLRTNVSVAAKFMMPELGLSQIQIGQVFSAFMVGYALFQTPAGALGDRFGPRRVLSTAALIWGLTTAMTGALPGIVWGGAGAFVLLLLIRFALGAAEAATYPVAAASISVWMPPGERAFANSLVIAGMALGSAFTGPLIAWIMETSGWRIAFLATSLLGFLLAGAWWWYATDSPREHAGVNDEEQRTIDAHRARADGPHGAQRRGGIVSWTSLLRNRNLVFICVSYFLSSYVLFMFVFWFYLYLINERHFDVLSGGFFSSAPWIAALILIPTAGYTCDRLSVRYGPRWGRRLVAMIGLLVSSALLVWGARAQGPYVAIAVLAVSVGFLTSTEGPFWSSAIDVSGSQAGTAGGIMNTAGNLGGVVSTVLVPVLVDRFGWMTTLASASALGLTSALLWLLVRVDEPAPDVADPTVAAVPERHGLDTRHDPAVRNQRVGPNRPPALVVAADAKR